MPTEVKVRGPIRLDQFLKWARLVDTGGTAKLLIQGGQVEVNGVVETRRGKTLTSGDVVTVAGATPCKVVFERELP